MTITTERELYSIPLSSITDEGTDNIRTEYDDAKLKELAISIKSKGLLTPLIVRQIEDDGPFLLVAGHRRYRALQILVKSGDADADQPVTCFVDDENSVSSATVTMLVEHLQREDIAIVDEARGYMRLVGEHGFKVKELAAAVGRSQAHINSRLALLTLDPDLLACVGGKVTIETALELTRVTDEKARKKMSKDAVKGSLGTWSIQTQLRDEEKARIKGKLIDWASKNMLTVHESPAAAQIDYEVYHSVENISLETMKDYVPKKGDILALTFYGDVIMVYRKWTKAELAAKAERAAKGLDERETQPSREVTPFTDWENRADAHEDAVTLYWNQANEAAIKLVLELPAKTIGKIIMEQAASSIMVGRSPRVDSFALCDLLDIEVVDQSAQQALAAHIGGSTEKALRFYAITAWRTQAILSPTLESVLDAEYERLGLVDPGEFTDPEPWTDEDGVWHTEEYVPPTDAEAEPTPEELADIRAEAEAAA